MKVVQKRLADLKRLEKNVRRHGEKQIAEYMRSLEMFGQIRPAVVDENGVILVGNGMYEAMRRLGWETCDCYVAEGLTENAKTKLMLADNRVYELGLTDMESFDEIIRGLGEDLDVPGWDEDLLQTITASIEEADAMVEGYGEFDAGDVDRMNARRPADIPPPHTPDWTNEPLQRPIGPMPDTRQVSDSPQMEPTTAPFTTLQGRYIVCPHCHTRFLARQENLPADEAGGE